MSMPRVQVTDSLSLSRLVQGMWRLAEAKDSSADATVRKIQLCLEQGITSFDHADIYGNYSCEALFGDALRKAPQLRKQIELITKCDICLLSDKKPGTRVKHYDTSAAHVNASVDASLRNLGTDTIDLLLIHRPDPLMDHRELGAALDQLVAQGKVRSVGVSNFMPWDVELLQSAMGNRLVAQQIEMGLLQTHAFTNGQLAHAQRNQMALMAWSPLGGGGLFGTGALAERLRPALHAMANEQGVGIDAVALAWLLHHPAKILPVTGTTDHDRISRESDALRVQFDRQSWFALYELALGHEVP
jgi:predicted oxidoreductase